MLNDRFAKIALEDMRRSRDETVRAKNAAQRTIILMANENRRALEKNVDHRGQGGRSRRCGGAWSTDL